MRAHDANLPLPIFMRRMTIELAKHVVMFLNDFPPKSGLSKTYSPRIIMTGKALDWKNSCKLNFGAYAQVHEDRNVTNTLEERTQEAICLGPTGNLQGTHNFFSIRSGEKKYPRTIHRGTHPHDCHETCGGNSPSQKIELRPDF